MLYLSTTTLRSGPYTALIQSLPNVIARLGSREWFANIL
jgi:hypothetical protein